MKQQEDSEERREMSRDLATLAMMWEVDPNLFRVNFAEFRRSVAVACHADGYPKLKFRHLVTRGGRQRFVVFFRGRQFDFFEFDIAGVGGNPALVRAMLEKMSFQPAG